jgi:anthranilate phosphoribosyltransferase
MATDGTTRTWSGLLTTLLGGASLTEEDTRWAMAEIMAGSATDAQIAGLAVALRAKGESVGEVAGLATSMLEFAHDITVPGRTVDIVGTGGDRAHTVNISTMASLVAAGAGGKVVKHGNRAASSSCGTADVLERLGVVIDLQPAQVARVAEEVGITFCFAPVFHPSYRFAAKARRELAVPTVFNFLGPLSNPSRRSASAIGVCDAGMGETLAGVLARRGADAAVFRGDDGLDELTTTTTSTVWVVTGGRVRRETVDPAALGIAPATPEALRGGDVEFNAAAVRRLVEGEPGAVRDAVLLNAAAALAVHAGLGADFQADLAEGYRRAAEAVDDGAAARILDRWVESSQAQAKSA